MAVKIQPLGDRVVVKPLEKEEKTKGGIFIPDTAKEKPQDGKVLAVGPGKMSDDGKRLPMDVAVGDIVYFTKYAPDELEVDGNNYLVIKQSSVLAKQG